MSSGAVRIAVGLAILCLPTAGTAQSAKNAFSVHADALRALDTAYVTAWKASGAAQAEAVMALFADDAVIMPGAGADPHVGRAALRNFWFPADAPPTDVLRFEHDITGIEIALPLGVVRGRYALDFEYDGARYERTGNYLFVARRQDDGVWRITQMIWNDREA